MSTVTPSPPPPAPDPGHSGDGGPNGWIDLVKWVLGDPRRAVWVLASLVVIAAMVVGIAAYLAPYVGELGGVLGGGLVGGGITIGAGTIAQRRCSLGRIGPE